MVLELAFWVFWYKNPVADDSALSRRAPIHLKPPGQAKSAPRRSVMCDAKLMLITPGSLVPALI
jgi:hypothetical protein